MSLSDDIPRNGSGKPETGVVTLIDELLAEQRRLTAVEKFSRLHDRHDGPLLESHYRDLIPLTAPRPGEQYAFEVHLDQCSGCKGCVTACHSLNGLDDDESWREVGFLVGEALVPLNAVKGEAPSTPASPYSFSSIPGNKVIPLQQTVTAACHHCVEPGCMLGCPVLAYDKDPLTGIVRHLDDQCIGCSYCILKCPYDVPKYSAKRGIVRKCDMCQGRLAEGEAPACVQACPNEAIRITVVTAEKTRGEFRNSKPATADGPSNRWLSDAPQPNYTLPTTRYISAAPNTALRAADHSLPKPQHAHLPLTLMLTLTQAGIGGFVAAAAMVLLNSSTTTAAWMASISFALLSAGLVASAFHLGQPTKAWRVWIGWRTSWLSREAIALNIFAGAATAALAALWAGALANSSAVPEKLVPILKMAAGIPAVLWAAPVMLLGVVALFSQAMVYADTRRMFWRLSLTAPKFLGTTALLGIAFAAVFAPSGHLFAAWLGVTLLKLALEISVLKHADSDSDRWDQIRRTATLQRGVLKPFFVARLMCGIGGGVLLPFIILTGPAPAFLPIIAAALCLSGELLERHLFFTSVSPDKMPGMP